MINEKHLEIIKKEVKKRMANSRKYALHDYDHVERVLGNAIEIVKELKVDNEIDLNLLKACCYLHDITYAESPLGLRTYMFEGTMVVKPAIEILSIAKVNNDDQKIVVEIIKKHPHSFPFKRLNKNADVYSKVLQDADTLDLFNEKRISQFNGSFIVSTSISNLYIRFGRKYLQHFLNYPSLANVFYAPTNLNPYSKYKNTIQKGLAHKNEDWYLKKYEDIFISFALPRIPKSIETYHLTYFTILWSALNVVFGYLASKNIYWFWGVSLMIFAQHVTDMLDGNLGRARNTGLVLWGFFMDHLLDFIFLLSLLTSYFFIADESYRVYIYLLYFLTGSLMFSGTLGASLTEKMTISYKKIGTSEIRYLLIIINAYLIHISTDLFRYSFVLIFILSAILIVKVNSLQKELWRQDMIEKEKQSK